MDWSIGTEGIFFKLIKNGQNVPYSSWSREMTHIHPSILILKELVSNSQALSYEDSVCIPHQEVCSLSDSDLNILDLPSRYSYDIRIDSTNDFGQKDFFFDWGFYEHSRGKRMLGDLKGSIFMEAEGLMWVLTQEQFDLCLLLTEFNELPRNRKTFQNNLYYFSKIKKKAKRAGAILHPFLEGEEVLIPQKIRLNVDVENEDLVIEPEIDEDISPQFKQKFHRFPRARDVYSVQQEGKNRKRILFTSEQKIELQKVKDNSRISGEDKKGFLKHPQEIFDPEIIDLDDFSARVSKIGQYEPKHYPFIRPYKSQWIPGVMVEKSPDDKIKITLETEDDNIKIKEAIDKAEKEGEDSIVFKGETIPLKIAKQLLNIAERGYKSDGKKEVEQEINEEQHLIILENIEDLEYSEEYEEGEINKINYMAPPHLREGFDLKLFQQEGIAWLQLLIDRSLSGALLADDMGLGKTLQILSLLDWYNSYHNKDFRPFLVVAPVALLDNWAAEYDKFFNKTIDIITYYRESEPLSRLLKKGQSQIVLTNYETLRRQQIDICKIDWSIVVLDEAQRIKTPGTLVTNSAKALKSKFKIAMTGTPVENTLVDYWCIMDFIVPGLLGSARDFAKLYQDPLKDSSTDIKSLGEDLRHKTQVYLKRRLKEDVLKDLPQKKEKFCSREMPSEQLQMYEKEIECKKSFSDLTPRDFFSLINSLKDICDHPYLSVYQPGRIEPEQLIKKSAKLQLLQEILELIKKEEEKVIIYTDRKKTQRLLLRVLTELFGIEIGIINGDTPVTFQGRKSYKKSRQSLIDNFQNQEGFNMIIMSPLAAGVGLNITGANHVIHFSRLWNPAKEDQATDRVYRIGQEKKVFVYYLASITPSFETFDIIIHNLLLRKRELASSSLFPTERIEVVPTEIYQDIKQGTYGSKEEDNSFVDLNSIDNFEPHFFEAFIAALWKKTGFTVVLTPKTNDKGADVVAFSEEENLLIQVKMTKSTIDDRSIGEILKSRGYYFKEYNKSFNLLVVTNGSFNERVYNMGIDNEVEIIDRKGLQEILKQHKITLSEIKDMEIQRVDKI